jgi:hypothetical protein
VRECYERYLRGEIGYDQLREEVDDEAATGEMPPPEAPEQQNEPDGEEAS